MKKVLCDIQLCAGGPPIEYKLRKFDGMLYRRRAEEEYSRAYGITFAQSMNGRNDGRDNLDSLYHSYHYDATDNALLDIGSLSSGLVNTGFQFPIWVLCFDTMQKSSLCFGLLTTSLKVNPLQHAAAEYCYNQSLAVYLIYQVTPTPMNFSKVVCTYFCPQSV